MEHDVMINRTGDILVIYLVKIIVISSYIV